MSPHAGALPQNQAPISESFSDEPLHEIADHKHGYQLFIWALAIVAQALLCIWMIVQASAPVAP